MALISCVECHKEVSDQVSSCPACGHPIAVPEKLENQMIAVLKSIAFIGLWIAALCAGLILFAFLG